MKTSPWMMKPLPEETGIWGAAHVVIRVEGYAPAARPALLRCFEHLLRYASGVEVEDLDLQGLAPGFYQVGAPEYGVHFRLQEDGTMIIYEDDHIQDSYSKHLRNMSETYRDILAAALLAVDVPSPDLKIEVHYHF